MSYPIELKQEIQKRMQKGEKVKDLSKETGIASPTLYNWKKQINLNFTKDDNKVKEKNSRKKDEDTRKESKEQLKSNTITKTESFSISKTKISSEDKIETNVAKIANTNNNNAKEEFRERSNINLKLVQGAKQFNSIISNINRLLRRLEQDKVQTYIRMQSSNSKIKKSSIERFDKIEVLMDHLKDSITIIQRENVASKEKEDATRLLERINEKFTSLESKEKLNDSKDYR